MGRGALWKQGLAVALLLQHSMENRPSSSYYCGIPWKFGSNAKLAAPLGFSCSAGFKFLLRVRSSTLARKEKRLGR